MKTLPEQREIESHLENRKELGCNYWELKDHNGDDETRIRGNLFRTMSSFNTNIFSRATQSKKEHLVAILLKFYNFIRLGFESIKDLYFSGENLFQICACVNFFFSSRVK